MTIFSKNAVRMWAIAAKTLARLQHDSLLRNSLFIMSTSLFTSGLGYIYWLLAAKLTVAHDVGLSSALIAAMSLTSLLATLGLNSTLIQLLPRSISDKIWSLTINTGLIIAIVVGLIMAMIALWLFQFLPQFSNLNDSRGYAVLFILGVPLWTVGTLLDAIYTAERAAHFVLARQGAFAVLKIILFVLLIPLNLGAMGLFLSWTAGTFLSLITGVWYLRFLPHRYELTMDGVVRQFRLMFASLAGHHLINIGGAAPMYLLPILVTTRLSPTDNAYFYTTWLMGGLFFIISPAVSTALFAEGAHTALAIRKYALSSLMLIGVLLGFAAIALMIGGRLILTGLGPQYVQQGMPLLVILIVSAVPDAITNVYLSLLRVQARLQEGALLNLGMAAVALVLAWLILPSHGIIGAGWAWLIAQIIGCVYVVIRLALRLATP